MPIVLDVCCGLFWGFAYVVAIVLGFKNKTHYIPGLSICMNFAWEFWVVVSRIRYGEIFSIAFFIQLTWLILDIGIVLTWQLFRKRKKLTCVKDICCFGCAFIIVFIWAFLGAGWESSVFVINLIMSLDFIIRLHTDNAKHTSLMIAVAKMIGTLAATILNGIVYVNALVCWLGGLCLILDIYYIVLLVKGGGYFEKKQDNIS